MSVLPRPGERHTRQGLARGQTHSIHDPNEPTQMWSATSFTAMKDKELSHKRGGEENLPVLFGPGCWCGEKYGHDWPGKAEGGPHPR